MRDPFPSALRILRRSRLAPRRTGCFELPLLVPALALALATATGCDDAEVARARSREAILVAAPEALLRVRTEEVRRTRMAASERVTGTVRAFHRATVPAETQGRVEAREVEPGAVVEQGGVIVRLESSRHRLALRHAEASLQAARTVLEHAERELRRGRRLADESAISDQRLDDLSLAVDRARDEIALAKVARDTAQRDLEDTRIRAPFAGTVDSIEVDVGDYVAPGAPVATVVDLSRVRIFGGVTAGEAARLAAGQEAEVVFVDLGGRTFEATLKSVGRVADAEDGTYEIELWMDNPEGLLRDGLVARIELPDPDRRESLVVPRAALLRRGGRPEVFVVRREGGRPVAHVRTVRTGRVDGGWIEVVEGLEEGEQVVYDGQFALADGSPVVIDGESQAAGAPSPEEERGSTAANATANTGASASGPGE